MVVAGSRLPSKAAATSRVQHYCVTSSKQEKQGHPTPAHKAAFCVCCDYLPAELCTVAQLQHRTAPIVASHETSPGDHLRPRHPRSCCAACHPAQAPASAAAGWSRQAPAPPCGHTQRKATNFSAMSQVPGSERYAVVYVSSWQDPPILTVWAMP
jgi:hypothetical protein